MRLVYLMFSSCAILVGCDRSETSEATASTGPETAFTSSILSESCKASLDRLREIAGGPGGPDSWTDRLAAGREVFKTLITGDDWQCFDALSGEFGKHGDKVDFLILLSAPWHTFPTNREFTRFTLPESNPFGVATASYHAGRLRAAEIMAKRFVAANDAWRRRLYRATLWSLLFQIHWTASLDEYVAATRAGFDEATGEDVWWYVRSALLLMYSTHELPDLEELTPEAVHAAFDERADRLPEDMSDLTPGKDGLFWERRSGLSLVHRDEPLVGAREMPFLKWQGPVPTHDQLLDHSDRSIF